MRGVVESEAGSPLLIKEDLFTFGIGWTFFGGGFRRLCACHFFYKEKKKKTENFQIFRAFRLSTQISVSYNPTTRRFYIHPSHQAVFRVLDALGTPMYTFECEILIICPR